MIGFYAVIRYNRPMGTYRRYSSEEKNISLRRADVVSENNAFLEEKNESDRNLTHFAKNS